MRDILSNISVGYKTVTLEFSSIGIVSVKDRRKFVDCGCFLFKNHVFN